MDERIIQSINFLVLDQDLTI